MKTTPLTRGRIVVAVLALVAIAPASFAQIAHVPTADRVAPELAAERAVETFYELTNSKAEVIGTQTDLVCMPDTDAEWVSVGDPGDADFPYGEEGEWERWDTVGGSRGFVAQWSDRVYSAVVARPLPVTITLQPDTPQVGKFRIIADFRACHEWPSTETGTWTHVNLGATLKRNSGGTTGMPVTITYPGNVTKVTGNSTQYFYPSGIDDQGTIQWDFTDNGNQKGGEFRVTVTGWALDFTSYSYTTDQDDELLGWGVLRMDSHLFEIKDSDGDVVAAIGDEGNLYLEGTLDEWNDSITQSANTSELAIKDSSGNLAALFDDTGNLSIAGLAHGHMDDLGDTCDTVDGNSSEQDYLDNPPAPSLKITNSSGDVVAYVDEDGNLRHKGMVFENWTDWDFLD